MSSIDTTPVEQQPQPNSTPVDTQTQDNTTDTSGNVEWANEMLNKSQEAQKEYTQTEMDNPAENSNTTDTIYND